MADSTACARCGKTGPAGRYRYYPPVETKHFSAANFRHTRYTYSSECFADVIICDACLMERHRTMRVWYVVGFVLSIALIPIVVGLAGLIFFAVLFFRQPNKEEIGDRLAIRSGYKWGTEYGVLTRSHFAFALKQH